MNWTNRNALATVLAVSLAVGPAVAQAQVTAPSAEVPDVPDEPLPEWHPPRPRGDVVHLDVAPEVKKAQDTRQAGLWLCSIGGGMLFGGGLLYARAAGFNDEAGKPHGVAFVDDHYNIGTMVTNVFDPNLEDQKNLNQAGALALLVIGAAFTVAGFAAFGVGQYRIRAWHKKNPRDPLPPLSGYEQVK
jgi:hypothetical protein